MKSIVPDWILSKPSWYQTDIEVGSLELRLNSYILSFSILSISIRSVLIFS